MIRGNILGESKYTEFGILINFGTAEPGYGQNHMDDILAINALLLHREQSSGATMIFDVNMLYLL